MLLFPPPQGFPKLFINNWFPSYISAKTAGNRRDGTKRFSWDLIRSIKKGLRHGRFCSFECFKIWPDCLNFKHWPILSSASGALFIFTVKSTLTNRVDQNKKEEEENGCVQAVHYFITLSKATFDLLDTPTAPGCFAVSVYSHVSHKGINYQTTVTDDSC